MTTAPLNPTTGDALDLTRDATYLLDGTVISSDTHYVGCSAHLTGDAADGTDVPRWDLAAGPHASRPVYMLVHVPAGDDYSVFPATMFPGAGIDAEIDAIDANGEALPSVAIRITPKGPWHAGSAAAIVAQIHGRLRVDLPDYHCAAVAVMPRGATA